MEILLEVRKQRNTFFFLSKVSKKRKEFEMHSEIKLHSKFLLFSFNAETFVFANKHFSLLNCKFVFELKHHIITKAGTKS